MKNHGNSERLLSLLLTLIMVFTLVLPVFAEDKQAEPTEVDILGEDH